MTAVRFALQLLATKAARVPLLIAFTFVSSMPLAHADGVEYAYDENGRLTIVYAPSGDAAQYVYDPAGNITAINRFTAGTINAIDFQPKSGPAGTQVTIYGTGFSTTPSQNSVSFNGTAATVSSSAANKLIVTVPAVFFECFHVMAPHR
jgi:large repetitive protein